MAATPSGQGDEIEALRGPAAAFVCVRTAATKATFPAGSECLKISRIR
jgi:hypothetical protein